MKAIPTLPRPQWVLLKKFVQETGYSAAAVRGKIRHGVWIEGQHYRRAPDGHILIDMEEFRKWLGSQQG